MESGALSDKDFPTFSANVIPFLHVTSKIEGMKHDGLLKEKGFRGFPSLAFMDAEGNIIHKQGARSVEAFNSAMIALPLLADLEKRIAAGEEGLEFELLVAKWDLGQASYDDVVKVSKMAKGLNKKQKATLAAMMINAEVDYLAKDFRNRDQEKSEAALRTAGPRFQEILKSGAKLDDGRQRTIWNGLKMYAELEGDAELFAKVVDYFKKSYGDNSRYASYIERMEKQLEDMRKAGSANP